MDVYCRGEGGGGEGSHKAEVKNDGDVQKLTGNGSLVACYSPAENTDGWIDGSGIRNTA